MSHAERGSDDDNSPTSQRTFFEELRGLEFESNQATSSSGAVVVEDQHPIVRKGVVIRSGNSTINFPLKLQTR